MRPLIWMILPNLLPIAAALTLPWPRARRVAVPWLGFGTVILGSFWSFSSSSASSFDGAGIGLPIAWFYALVGLSMVVIYVRLRPLPFVPLGAIAAGLIHTVSFYGLIPPFHYYFEDIYGMLIATSLGLALVSYGVVLWIRNGVAGSMSDMSVGLRTALALVCIMGLGAIGFAIYQGSQVEDWRLNNPPDMRALASHSDLVVEGVVVGKEHYSYKSQNPDRRIRYTLYEVVGSIFWRGTGADTVLVAVRDYSPVDLTVGQSYLLFSSGLTDIDDLPGHYWDLDAPVEAWTVSGDSFHPYPGLNPATPVSRDELMDTLAQYPHEG